MKGIRGAYRTLGRITDVTNPTPRHYARKAVMRGTMRGMRGSGCLLPVVAVLVAVGYSSLAVLAYPGLRHLMAVLWGVLA